MVVDAVFQEVVKPLGINICNTQWGKPLKNGLYEIGIRHLLPTLHLSNDAKRQRREIERARRYFQSWTRKLDDAMCFST